MITFLGGGGNLLPDIVISLTPTGVGGRGGASRIIKGSGVTDYDENLYMNMKFFWDLFSTGRLTSTVTCTILQRRYHSMNCYYSSHGTIMNNIKTAHLKTSLHIIVMRSLQSENVREESRCHYYVSPHLVHCTLSHYSMLILLFRKCVYFLCVHNDFCCVCFTDTNKKK